jgi:hypothetical protein
MRYVTHIESFHHVNAKTCMIKVSNILPNLHSCFVKIPIVGLLFYKVALLFWQQSISQSSVIQIIGVTLECSYIWCKVRKRWFQK